MYLSFHSLREPPFNLTPDPRFLFMSRSHRDAFDHLLFGIKQRCGFVEVVGGIGTGKTTLCRALMNELEGKMATALIFNTFLSEQELLTSINEEFGVPVPGATRKEIVDALNKFLLERLARGNNACLIIDECQNLQVSALEQIRMLSNLETESEKLLQIVMMGQSEFHDTLKSPALRQLDERIQVRAFLEPLDSEDTRAYILHRLSVAGSKGDVVFTDGALKVIYDYSSGNPRRINKICDRCLLIAYSRDANRISRDHALRAFNELRDEGSSVARKAGTREKIRWQTPVRWPLIALLGFAGLVTGWILAQSAIFNPFERGANPRPSPPPATATRVEETAPPPQLASVAKDHPAPLPQDEGKTDQSDQLFPGLVELQPPPPGASIQEVARSMDMQTARFQLSWEILRRLRRPCILELNEPGATSSTHCILRGLSQKGVLIQRAGEEASGVIEKDALGEIWFGSAWLLWPRAIKVGVLKISAKGEAVVGLQEGLARLGYLDVEPNGIFDEETRRAVMAFQRDLHLRVDGVAGPLTYGMLYQLLSSGDEDA